MTREEIREEAEGIVRTACNLQRNASLQAANDAVEAKVAALARATLEEAARAVCSKCARNENIADDGLHEPSLEECDAVRVRDLIAALDGSK